MGMEVRNDKEPYALFNVCQPGNPVRLGAGVPCALAVPSGTVKDTTTTATEDLFGTCLRCRLTPDHRAEKRRGQPSTLKPNRHMCQARARKDRKTVLCLRVCGRERCSPQ